MAHFALTDVEEGRFRAFERFARGAQQLAGVETEPFRAWLEDWELAHARGANVLGEVLGSASTADAHHITAPKPEGAGAVRCAARRSSGRRP